MTDQALDLSGNNLVPTLLEEREQVKRIHDKAATRLKELNDELKDMLGEYSLAVLPGWQIELRRWNRREFTVPAQKLKAIYAKRVSEDE